MNPDSGPSLTGGELLQGLYVLDGIACVALALAFIGVPLAKVTRGGGLNAQVIFAIFVGAATLGSLLRIIVWGGARVVAVEVAEPSGTDVIIFIGILLVAVYLFWAEMMKLFVGDPTQESILKGIWRRLGAAPSQLYDFALASYPTSAMLSPEVLLSRLSQSRPRPRCSPRTKPRSTTSGKSEFGRPAKGNPRSRQDRGMR